MPTWAPKSDFLSLKLRPTRSCEIESKLLTSLGLIVCKMGIMLGSVWWGGCATHWLSTCNVVPKAWYTVGASSMLSLFAVQEQLSLPGNFLGEASSVSSLLLWPFREACPCCLRRVPLALSPVLAAAPRTSFLLSSHCNYLPCWPPHHGSRSLRARFCHF